MATYNGEKYIAEQLNSLAAQTHANWQLIVSDDGSTDNTLAILQKYQMLWGPEKIVLVSGPRNGFAQNFLSMACDQQLHADYYAFCDQDDVWLPEKLEVAIGRLGRCNAQIPCLYGGRTVYVTEKLIPYQYSPKFVRPPSLQNALVQNIASGNTMVFNRASKTLFERTGRVPTPWHDWWLYQLVTGAEGEVLYDLTPYVLYRQHSDSVQGGSTSFWARIRRISSALMGELKPISDQNIQCLQLSSGQLAESSKKTIDNFVKMRSAKLTDRLRLYKCCGLYRQTWIGSKTLFIEALLRKI